MFREVGRSVLGLNKFPRGRYRLSDLNTFIHNHRIMLDCRSRHPGTNTDIVEHRPLLAGFYVGVSIYHRETLLRGNPSSLSPLAGDMPAVRDKPVAKISTPTQLQTLRNIEDLERSDETSTAQGLLLGVRTQVAGGSKAPKS